MARKKLTYEHFKSGTETIIRFLKPHKGKVLILAAVSLISAIGNSFTPYLLGKFFDALIGNSQPVTIFVYNISPLVLILGIWTIARLTTDISERYHILESERLEALVGGDYIIAGMSRLMRLPMSFHKKHKMGEIINRIERAGARMSHIMSRVIITIAPDFFSVFIAFVIVIYIDPILTTILFGGLVIYIIAIVLATPRYASLLDGMNKAYNKAYGDTYDSIINVSAVKEGSAENHETRKLFKNFRFNIIKHLTAYMKIYSNLTFSQRIIVTGTQLILFIISINFIQDERITIGDLIAFNGYAALIFGPFYRLSVNWDLIQNGLISLKRAEAIVNLPEEIYIPQNAIVLSEVKGDVVFKNVCFNYGKKQNEILRNITFHAKAGETIALVGESGVGKSTLIDLISCYYKLIEGNIFIDGHDVNTIDLTSLRSFIAVVAQEPVLFNDTIKFNIKYGSFNLSDKKMINASQLAHADEFIQKFPKKYDQRVGDRGIRLSAGQKQRIAIARAILRNPKILILDEPTSALDAKSEKYITESLEWLMKGRTTFIIAHRLSTVRKADTILVLDKANIVERGKHEELKEIRNGTYKKLYDLQIGLK